MVWETNLQASVSTSFPSSSKLALVCFLTQLRHGKCLLRYHYRNITRSGKFEIYKRNKTKKKPKKIHQKKLKQKQTKQA